MKNRFSLLFVLMCTVLSAQTSCEVWQWLGTDSANRIVASQKTYDANGNVRFEQVNGYYYGPNPYGGTEGQYISIYDDTILRKWYFVSPEGDSTRIEKEYDVNGRLIREVEKRYRYVPTDTMSSGMFTVNIVATDTADNNWAPRSESIYSYDSQGRKTQEKVTNPNWPVITYYKWTYDSLGRIATYQYVLNDKPRMTSVYVYSSRTVTVYRTRYDDNGKVVRKPGKKSPPYMQREVLVEVKDEQGRVIEEREQNRKGKVLERCVTSYNANGKTAREVWYDEAGNVILTHVFVYK